MPNVVVKGSVVFVTGANRERGIGRALVEEAVKRGAKKVYATSRTMSQLDELVSRYPGIVVPIRLDVTNKDDIARVAEVARDADILINNSGAAGSSGICFNYNEETARREIEVNYFGPLNLIRAFSRSLIGKKNAAVVNILSIGGLSAFPPAATYSASKAAAHSLTQTVRAELTRHGVSVFGVYPGPIDTDMADGLQYEKETSANVAIRIFDDMARGIEDITTDAFADQFVSNLRQDSKSLEKQNAELAHLMPIEA